MDCKHESFVSHVKVTRLLDDIPDIVDYIADVKINCAHCGLPFQFVGLPKGYSQTKPMSSLDATEARLPIIPTSDPVEKAKQIINEK